MELPKTFELRDPLTDFLRACCVRVLGSRPGCGFFVHPSLIVTCAHVVGREKRCGAVVEVQPWGRDQYSVLVGALSSSSDLAVLRAPVETRIFAPTNADVRLHDPIIAFGYPTVEYSAELDQITATIEGETLSSAPHGRTRTLLKLKGGQIESGFSGGPAINERTGQVAGILRMTRDTRSDLGGWAIPVSLLRDLCLENGIGLPESAEAWRDAYAEFRRLWEERCSATKRKAVAAEPVQVPSENACSRTQRRTSTRKDRRGLRSIFFGFGSEKNDKPTAGSTVAEAIGFLAEDIVAIYEDAERRDKVGDISLPRLIAELKSLQSVAETRHIRSILDSDDSDGLNVRSEIAEAGRLAELISTNDDEEIARAASLLRSRVLAIQRRFRYM